MELTVEDAQAGLPEIVRQALAGEEVVITFGSESLMLVKVAGIKEKKPIRMGWLKGQIPDVGLDHPFFAPLPEDELRLWNGEGE